MMSNNRSNNGRGSNRKRRRVHLNNSDDNSTLGNASTSSNIDDENEIKIDVRYKIFNDAVHKYKIKLHPLLVRIVDTPQFQRLRNIKQLGFTYLVYPAASHNRFEHSIGTCYLAGKLVRFLKTKQPELGITDVDVLCVEIAGLCHDLGHGPFSHLWEPFMARVHVNDGLTWTHEKASVQMFGNLIEENGLIGHFEKFNIRLKDLQFVKEMIDGPNELGKYQGRPKEKKFLYEIVSNKRSGVDVDKWDYFLRDSKLLGLKVSFAYDRLINSSRVITVNGKPQICFRDKEVLTVYEMFHTRWILHETAYQHRVVRSIDAMVVDALVEADQSSLRFPGSGVEPLRLSEVAFDMKAFTFVTDDIFQQILRGVGDEFGIKAKEILTRVLCRKLYSFIGKTLPNKVTSEKKLSEELIKHLPQDSSLVSRADGKPTLNADVVLQLVKLDYGMEKKNPVKEVKFYRKENPDQILSDDEVHNKLFARWPNNFQEVSFVVLYKKKKQKVITELKDALKKVNADAEKKMQQSDA